ncbi:cell division protein ZapA, partial [Bacillus pumilus]|uniref:cell division protein ZapA n=1 Tax=Bacillus pumilus TaxID=1408 RepID=UPI0037046B7E
MHIPHLPSILNHKMTEINQKNPYLHINKLPLLTPLNLLHHYFKLKHQYQKLQIHLKQNESNYPHPYHHFLF